jgi:hypothetical protein
MTDSVAGRPGRMEFYSVQKPSKVKSRRDAISTILTGDRGEMLKDNKVAEKPSGASTIL